MQEFEYLESVYNQSDITFKDISEIIDQVRSTKHQNLIDQIRRSKNEENTKELKLQLPVFYPGKTSCAKGDCIATGIVSIDVDLKNNDHININQLKSSIGKIPECLYAYISPRAGLKIGIKTDFEGIIDANTSTKDRFKIAYKHVVAYVQHSIDAPCKNFIPDNTSASIMQGCFLSFDPQLYYNEDCKTFQVNSLCTVNLTLPIQNCNSVEDNILDELLKFIPKNLSYAQRLPINYAVYSIIGEAGIQRMFSHWAKSERDVLLEQLKDQYKSRKFGNTAHLIAVAKQHGYKEKTGYQLRSTRAEDSNFVFDKLISVNAASIKLKKIVEDFFANKKNTFVNISTGAGKSTAVLDIIANEIQRNVRVLILVPTHALAAELMRKLSRARIDNFSNDLESYYPDKLDAFQNTSRAYKYHKRKQPVYSSAIHLKGKQQLCSNLGVIKDYGSASLIPWTYCSKCSHPTGCAYLSQFNNTFDNVRIMTHEEWSNEESVWSAGTDTEPESNIVYPKKKSLHKVWRPDFIVIDENIIKINSKEIVRDKGNRFISIRSIIESVKSGKTLLDAATKFVSDIVKDSVQNIKPVLKNYTTSDQLRFSKREYEREMKNYSPALDLLEKFIICGDAEFLKGFWISGDELCYHKLPRPAARYQNIPTLFLDATADQTVVRRVLGDIEYHSIAIEMKSDINLYQLGNTTISKTSLSTVESINELVEWIQEDILLKYDVNFVGLITYKSVPFEECDVDGKLVDFDEYLAHRLGVSLFDHFGNLRGLDKFDNVDCLLVIGRNFIGVDASRDACGAIFGVDLAHDSCYLKLDVRMKNGKSSLLESRVPVDRFNRSIRQHFSLSETVQAIGRGRVVHGFKKDIYIFSNENLGEDIEVSDFFYRQKKVKEICTPDIVSKIRRIGYVANTPKALLSVGFESSDIKSRRARITSELILHNIHERSCRMIDDRGRTLLYQYFIFNVSKFSEGREIDNKTLLRLVE